MTRRRRPLRWSAPSERRSSARSPPRPTTKARTNPLLPQSCISRRARSRGGPMQTLEAPLNQAPPLLGHNALDADPALLAALHREGAGWALDRAREVGELVASEEAQT